MRDVANEAYREALADVVAASGGKPARRPISAERGLSEEKTIFGVPCLVKSLFAARFAPGPHGEKRSGEFVVRICSLDGRTLFAEGEIHADQNDYPNSEIDAHCGYKIAFADAKKALKFSTLFLDCQDAACEAAAPAKLKP